MGFGWEGWTRVSRCQESVPSHPAKRDAVLVSHVPLSLFQPSFVIVSVGRRTDKGGWLTLTAWEPRSCSCNGTACHSCHVLSKGRAHWPAHPAENASAGRGGDLIEICTGGGSYALPAKGFSLLCFPAAVLWESQDLVHIRCAVPPECTPAACFEGALCGEMGSPEEDCSWVEILAPEFFLSRWSRKDSSRDFQLEGFFLKRESPGNSHLIHGSPGLDVFLILFPLNVLSFSVSRF